MKMSLIIIGFLSLALSGLALADGPAVPIPKTCHVAWPSTDFTPATSVDGAPLQPTTGIYWFNTNNPDRQESQMAAYTPGNKDSKSDYMNMLKENGYFDPGKPTIIFVHGWQPGSTSSKTRFDFCYNYPAAGGKTSPTYNVLGSWKGWNVGVFYWTQFADTQQSANHYDLPTVAESKIYSTNGGSQMSWAYLSKAGTLQHCVNGMSNCKLVTEDISQMLEKAYKNALPSKEDYKGAELRIAGQSLGTQLAMQLTDWVVTNVKTNDMPMPTRLSLMDPYMSPKDLEGNEHLPFPESVAVHSANTVSDIKKHDPSLPIDVYRTSTLSFAPTGDPAPKLMSEVAFMRLYPKYLDPTINNSSQLNALLHRASIYLYFVSKQHKPTLPPVAPAGQDSYANADADNKSILHLMGQKRYQVTTGTGGLGEDNFLNTQDDVYSSVEPLQPPEQMIFVPPWEQDQNSGGNMADLERLGSAINAANNKH